VLHANRHEGHSYDMTGPEALTMTEIAERISEAIGKTIRYVNVAPEDKRRALLAAGIPRIVQTRLMNSSPSVANDLSPCTSALTRHSEFNPLRFWSSRVGTRLVPW